MSRFGNMSKSWCYCLAALLLSACGDPAQVGLGAPDGVHPDGWKETHGAALRSGTGTLIDAIAPCAKCHDDGQEPTCDSCHAKPNGEGCRVCHDQLPETHAAHGAKVEDLGKVDPPVCVNCHQLPDPAKWRTTEHLDGAGAIHFGGRAVDEDHAPSFDPETRTCTNTACHARPGGAVPAPMWGTRFPEKTCDRCHGQPPPAPHPASDKCTNCHGPTMEEPHPDGKIDLIPLDDTKCDVCHGAPPETGAHLRHLNPLHAAPRVCEDCHVVPKKVTDPGHLDDGVRGGDVKFGPAAGENASYSNGTCSNVACHKDDAPAWNGAAPCGSCHGVPPKAPHPADNRCMRCHPNALPDGTPKDVMQHMDGKVDNKELAADACDSCHAEGAPVQPPGPHAAHVRFGCETCHPKPATPQAEGHMNGVVDIDIHGLPDPHGDPDVSVPGTYSGGQCNVPTCHMEGRPVWQLRTERLACDACHGFPPPNHSTFACDKCHFVPAAGVDTPTHQNGRIDLNLPTECDACHGNPPATGAHLRHISPRFSHPLDCSACHVKPVHVDDPGHMGPPPGDVVLAKGRYEGGRCVDTACHGNPGALVPAPAWNAGPDAGVADCGGCHGIPPPGHGPVDCFRCHAPTMGQGMRIVDPDHHVDGTIDRVGAGVVQAP